MSSDPDGENTTARLAGYLHHKGRKLIIPIWRRWYCVLNGSLLLFYKSEADHEKLLGKFHDSLDLGLAYDVQPAPGMDHGILITTHAGPQWLKIRDEETHRMWLEALQAAIVLRRQEDSTAVQEQKVAIKSHRAAKAKSVLSGNNEPIQPMVKETTKSFRFSLDFIPGQGKKYPSFDGTNFREASGAAQKEDEDPPIKAGKGKRTSKSVSNPRPISQSLSSFILLNSSSSKLNSGGNQEPVMVARELTGSPSPSRRPRIPTSFGVGKLLSNVQMSAGSVKSLDSLKAEEGQVVLLKSSSAQEVAEEIKPEPAQQVEEASGASQVAKEAPEEDVPAVVPRQGTDGDKKDKRDTPRRKSSFNVIKDFFIRAPSKVFRRTPKEAPNPTAVVEPVIQTADPAPLPLVQEDQKGQAETPTYLPQISESSVATVQEVPCVAEAAFDCEAKVLEVVEPEPAQSTSSSSSSSSQLDLCDMEIVTVAQVEPIPDVVLMGPMDADHFKAEDKPELPVKTKVKCPSPDYDIPRNNFPCLIQNPEEEHPKAPSPSNLEVPIMRRGSGETDQVRRISFAAAETELFEEESVQDLSDELK